MRLLIVDEINNNAEIILQYIQQNPGCYLRQIKRDLNMPMGTVQYHLDSLEKMGKINSEKHGFHRFYFPIGIFEEHQKNILKILNQETAREILLFIIETQRPTQLDIAEYVKISAPSVNWHIGRLVEFELINEIKDGKFKRYKFVGNSGSIVKLLKNYHPTLWHNWSNRLAEMFLSLGLEEKK
jgi:predicted transcriptional regulator